MGQLLLLYLFFKFSVPPPNVLSESDEQDDMEDVKQDKDDGIKDEEEIYDRPNWLVIL